ncbi:hypothetical protein Pth03_49380 [Planotetraspora thailandica]|uniref:DUF664 domain-containing protein n=1 Tax=Planotetraspora thailandica TaxID=487172 RepID=A0A8J3V9H9_9ACTN|nr:DUF664 domain-containing protein [Planotetraspora thailandica]GII56549.1 hypothetical protein Pth03_49380 [Planotetraspora thailandica]
MKVGCAGDTSHGVGTRGARTSLRLNVRLDLAAPGQVAHWPQERRDTTLGALLARMVAKTAQHAGHADIVREMIDGHGGSDHDMFDAEEWKRYVTRIQAAADTFAATGGQTSIN